MSFQLSFHLAPLGATGAHWLDDPPDVGCKDSTRQYTVDATLLSCNQQVGGPSPPARSQAARCKSPGRLPLHLVDRLGLTKQAVLLGC